MLCTGDEIRPYVEANIGAKLPDSATFIADYRDGQIVSAAGFANWFGHDVEVFLASAGALGRGFLKRLGRYAFDELGCTRVTCRVASDNPWCEVLPRVGLDHRARASVRWRPARFRAMRAPITPTPTMCWRSVRPPAGSRHC